MASRLYFDDDAAPVSPSFDGGWEATGDAIRRLLAREDQWSAVATTTQIISPSGVANRDYLWIQAVSEPIAAQTITGDLTGLFIVREDAVGNDARAQLVAKVVSGDGLTVRGTLIAMDTGALASEFGSSFGAREFPRSTATTISSVAAQDGDRIVIEVGFRAHGTGTGDTRLSHNVAPDIAAVGGTSAREWIEFSNDILWLKTGTDSFSTADTQGNREFETADTASVADSITDRAFETSDSFSGADAGEAAETVEKAGSDAFLFLEGALIETSWSTGKVHISKFEAGPQQYTIENEIIEHEQISEDQTRVNVVMIDGNLDSWTEYDRDDLIVRDRSVNVYLDMPELKTSGEVRQRAIEELRAARRVNSPGGTVVWQPWFTQKDSVFWVDEDGQKYTATIEGLEVEFAFSEEPYLRASIDTGNVLICEEDDTDVTYFVRDLFERETTDGLGDAPIGGTWTIYT
jgi:hypothetical protein